MTAVAYIRQEKIAIRSSYSRVFREPFYDRWIIRYSIIICKKYKCQKM